MKKIYIYLVSIDSLAYSNSVKPNHALGETEELSVIPLNWEMLERSL